MRALITVSNKHLISSFAVALADRDFSIMATEGTAEAIACGSTRIEEIITADKRDVVGLIEARHIATLVPRVQAALMIEYESRENVLRQGGLWIDLLCIDLYPIGQVATNEQGTLRDTLAYFDTGGSALIGAAIKGNRLILCDTADYSAFIGWVDQQCPEEDQVRLNMRLKALEHAKRHLHYLSDRLQKESGRSLPSDGQETNATHISVFPPFANNHARSSRPAPNHS